jgi:hypothetical protein
MPFFDALAHAMRSAQLFRIAFVAVLISFINILIRDLAVSSSNNSSATNPDTTPSERISPSPTTQSVLPASTRATAWTKRFNRSLETGDFYVGFDLLLAAFVAASAELWRTRALTERAVYAGAYEEWASHLDGVSFLAYSIAGAIAIGVLMLYALPAVTYPRRRLGVGYGLLALGVLMLVCASMETDAFQAPEVRHAYPIKGPVSSVAPRP